MVVKRLGSSPSGGKAATIGAAVAGELDDVSRQLETPLDRNRGTYERVSLDTVSPDPHNPRNLKLTFEELSRGVKALHRGVTTAETERERIYESIADLAETFKDVGQLHPITTYRDERGRLRIVDGERRYWAARLLGQTFLDAKVKPKKPDYVRLEQYVANVQREDLTLSQHLNNLEMCLKEAEEQGRQVTSLNQFASLIHRPRTTAQRWWGVLKGPDDVRAAIASGKLQSIERAYTAAQERDAGRRAALLSGEVLPVRDAKRVASRGGGRPRSRVSLGGTKDVEIIRTLVHAVAVGESFEEVNWGDLAVVQKTWQRFLKALESKLKKGSVPVGAE